MPNGSFQKQATFTHSEAASYEPPECPNKALRLSGHGALQNGHAGATDRAAGHLVEGLL